MSISRLHFIPSAFHLAFLYMATNFVIDTGCISFLPSFLLHFNSPLYACRLLTLSFSTPIVHTSFLSSLHFTWPFYTWQPTMHFDTGSIYLAPAANTGDKSISRITVINLENQNHIFSISKANIFSRFITGNLYLTPVGVTKWIRRCTNHVFMVRVNDIQRLQSGFQDLIHLQRGERG